MWSRLCLFLCLLLAPTGVLGQTALAELRLNQIQVIGTHNSYHKGLGVGVGALIRGRDPKAYDALDYQHGPLYDQLDRGVRQIELDVYADAQGGRYAQPFGAKLEPGGLAAFDPEGVMSRPGLKVMHVQDIDYRSVCQPFVACLEEVRRWSIAHPRHAPIFILVETKTQGPLPGLPMASPEPFTTAALDGLDKEILSVFGPASLITPDEVRGGRSTLDEAVRTDGWPTLAKSQGRIVFLLDQASASEAYLVGHPALKGRVLFTNSQAGQADAGFIELNDGPSAEIQKLVKAGYLVRTRSDADTREGRTGAVQRRDEALGSGAQIVSTDYPWFEPARWTGYAVSLPDHSAIRANPVNAPRRTLPAAPY